VLAQLVHDDYRAAVVQAEAVFNEMMTIRARQELAAAEKWYYLAQENHYAEKTFSDDGQHDGLCWKTVGREPKNPIGPMLGSR
jgi:hypothetical protein